MTRLVNSLPLSQVMLSGDPFLESLPSVHREISFHPYTFAGELIDYGQNAIRTAVGKFVADEIHRPALIGAFRRWWRQTLSSRDFLPLLGSDCQPFFGIQPVHTLGIHLPTFPPKEHGEAAVAVANVRRREFLETLPQSVLAFCVASVPTRAPLCSDHTDGATF